MRTSKNECGESANLFPHSSRCSRYFDFSLLGASHVAAPSVAKRGPSWLISSVREPESRQAHGRPRCCHRRRSAESPAACRCGLPGNPSTQSQPLCRQFRPCRRRCCLRWTLLHHQVRHHVTFILQNGILSLISFFHFMHHSFTSHSPH